MRVCVCVCVYVCEIYASVRVPSVMSDSVTPWTVVCQTPVHGIYPARILQWVTTSSSRGS